MSLGSNHLEDSLQRMAQYQFQNAKTSSVHSQGRSRMLHICSVVWPESSDRDDRTWAIPMNLIPDFTTFCNGTNLDGITIGVPRNSFGNQVPTAIMVSFESAINIL